MNPELLKRLRDPGFATRMMGYDRASVDALLAELEERIESREFGTTEQEALEAELSGVGEKVEGILAAAREAADLARNDATEKAQAMTKQAEQRFEQVKGEADEYSSRTRSEADEYSSTSRSEADQYSSDTRAEANQYSSEARAEADGYDERTRSGADSYAEEIRAAADREAERIRNEARSEGEALVVAAEQEAEEILAQAQVDLRGVETEIEDLRARRQLVIASIERMRGSLGSMVGESQLGTGEWARAGEDLDHEADGVHRAQEIWEPGEDGEITVRHAEARELIEPAATEEGGYLESEEGDYATDDDYANEDFEPAPEAEDSETVGEHPLVDPGHGEDEPFEAEAGTGEPDTDTYPYEGDTEPFERENEPFYEYDSDAETGLIELETDEQPSRTD